MIKHYSNIKQRRKARVRSKIYGSSQRPRLVVFRSNKHIFAQIIDDQLGKTIVSAGDFGEKNESGKKSKPSKNNDSLNKTQKASQIGEQLAQKALKAKITTVRFDRGHYKFHGRIKALAESARKSGLEF